MISFNVSREEFDLIDRIAERGMRLPWSASMRPPNRMELQMDITAAHANGCPLYLAGLLHADDPDFAHDVGGIRRHLDRSTGELGDCFLPRYAAQQGERNGVESSAPPPPAPPESR